MTTTIARRFHFTKQILHKPVGQRGMFIAECEFRFDEGPVTVSFYADIFYSLGTEDVWVEFIDPVSVVTSTSGGHRLTHNTVNPTEAAMIRLILVAECRRGGFDEAMEAAISEDRGE